MRLFIALFFVAFAAAAQTPEVPHKMQFAGMTLTIRDDARREIQKDVNTLTQSPRHHLIKVERARTYFPIIQKVFEEEQVPDDFKYLVLQESALIADAVSVSNAVGFWQFKDFTALEMGLRVDKEVDERLNIVSSTRAAARYIKKNNLHFNNWIYALQAYQMGAGGVMKAVDKHASGEKHMEITSGTYWYVKKFLAHKIAFEDAVNSEGQIKVVTYENTSKKLLAELAREISVDENELKQYNKWAKTGAIPGDRSYMVMIPMQGEGKPITLPSSTVASSAGPSVSSEASKGSASAVKDRTKINGISAIRAHAGESPAQLASRAGVQVSEFTKWNDISQSDRLQADQYYLLGKKRGRASAAYHKVTANDNLWSVSQQYGLQIKKLKRYNRISSDSEIKPGMTLWLSSMKPRDSKNERETTDIVKVDDTEFSWTASPEESQASVLTKPAATEPEIITLTPPTSPTEIPKETGEVKVEMSQEENSNIDTVSERPVQVSVPVSTENSAIVKIAPPDSAGTIKVIVPDSPKLNKTEHAVQSGETLYAIAKQYGLGVMDLVNWNGLNVREGIRPGQILRLTDPEVPVSEPVIAKITEIEHVVKSTDTLYSVARKYNVTIKELMEWNNKKDFNLSVGEKLRVKNK